MIIPTLGCPANCSYCWSSEETSPIMSVETVKKTAEWIKSLNLDGYLATITFHGGEPLLAGADFYRQSLPILAEGLKDLNPSFAIQTNLWRMTPEIAEILAEYGIPVGSSLDGPKDITDTQRGSGYYDRTLAGCKIAQDAGLRVRFICTFTKLSFERKEEIFNFFMENGMPLKLHPALPSIRSNEPEKYALPPEKYGELLVYLLDKAILNIDRAEILNINDLCRCVFTRQGNVCTYADCMGTTFAIGPDGSIYPCYRFVGMENYVMGNVYDSPSWDDLKESRAWKLMFEFKDFVDAHCADCRHISYCRGGCPYNAIALTDGVVRDVDPHCPAYKRIFDEISDRLDSEMYEDDSFDCGSSRRRRRKTAGVNDLIRKIISQN